MTMITGMISGGGGMKKAAVLIEGWKLPIFSRHLREAGYSYDTGLGITPGLITLQVEYDDVASLKLIIQAAQDECAASKVKKP